MAEEQSKMLLAFVALNSPRVPTQMRVISLMQKKYAADPVPTAELDEEREGGAKEEKPGKGEKPESVFVGVPDGMAFYSLMPAPIPWGDLEGPCETTLFWRDAEKKLRNHTHHLIVSLMGGPGTPLERHIWFTKFVAAVTEQSDAAGIYWGAGTVVNSPEVLCEQAEVLTPDDLFPPLWVDHRLWQDGGKFYFATTGLHAFDLPELEAEGGDWPPDEFFEFCQNLVTYIIKRGAAIGDGETIGRSAEEKFKVRHKKSMWDRPGKVMKFVIP
jgi:hypothetical protein